MDTLVPALTPCLRANAVDKKVEYSFTSLYEMTSPVAESLKPLSSWRGTLSSLEYLDSNNHGQIGTSSGISVRS